MKKNAKNRTEALVTCDGCRHAHPVLTVRGYGGRVLNCTCDRRPKPEWQMYGWPHDCKDYEPKK